MSTLKTEEKAEFIHPLSQKTINSTPFYWSDWLKQWNETCNQQQLLNLLHIGFDTALNNDTFVSEMQNRNARIIFYLECAYNYVFMDCDYTNGYLRKELSQKAFSVLCKKLFRDDKDNTHQSPAWFADIVSEEILPRIFWFFKATHAIPHSQEHDSIIATKFLFDLARLGWGGGGCEFNGRELLEQYRPDFIWLLWEIGKLEYLWKKRDLLTEKDIETLSNMVSAEIYKSEDPRIEEALLGGNQLAEATRVVICLRAYMKEKALQTESREYASSEVNRLKGELHVLEQKCKRGELILTFPEFISQAEELKGKLAELKKKILEKKQELKNTEEVSSDLYNRYK